MLHPAPVPVIKQTKDLPYKSCKVSVVRIRELELPICVLVASVSDGPLEDKYHFTDSLSTGEFHLTPEQVATVPLLIVEFESIPTIKAFELELGLFGIDIELVTGNDAVFELPTTSQVKVFPASLAVT